MKNSFKWAVLLTIILLVLGLFWLLSPFVNAANSVPNLAEVPQRIVTVLATVINPVPIVTIEDRSPTILEGAKNLGELTTYSMTFAKVGLEARLRFGIRYACEVKEKYAAQGEIKAGIDLNSLQIELRGDKYVIKVRSARLTDCHVKTDTYNRTGENQILCPADPEMYKFGEVAATNIFIKDANEKKFWN